MVGSISSKEERERESHGYSGPWRSPMTAQD
jgi:hypothetical protein